MIAQGKAVLVLPDPIPEKTAGGLAIPKTAKENLKWGTVIEAGPECELTIIGNRVLFSPKSASVISIEDKEYLFIQEDKISFWR
jgi:co-chaperonin GroES (HSP10)